MLSRIPASLHSVVFLAAAVLLAPAFAGTALAATYVLPVTDDTHIDRYNPNAINGTSPTLGVGWGDALYALLQFDLSSIGANETITSAELFVWVTKRSSASNVRVFRVTAPWDGASATWNTMSTNIDPTTTWGSFVPATNLMWASTDVADLVRAWQAGVTDHGLALVAMPVDNLSQYASSEDSNPGLHPYLQIETAPSSGVTNLVVSKSVGKAAPAESDSVLFTVSILNFSLVTADSVVVRDPIPNGLTLLEAGMSRGTYDPVTGVWTIGTMPIGASASLNLLTQVDNGTAGRTITNWAWYPDSLGQDWYPDDDADSASVTVGVATGADVGVAIAVDDALPSVGQTVTLTADLTNGGPDAATGIKTVVALPAGLTAGLSSTTAGTWDSGSGLWSVPALAAGDSARLTIASSVDLGTEGDTLAVTAAVSSLDQVDPSPGNDTDAVTLIVQSADLSVVTAVDNPTPGEGEVVTFTTLLGNAGPTGATGVLVTDALPAGLTYSGHTVSRGSYDSLSGAWTAGSIPVAGTDSLVVTATVDGGTAGNSLVYSVAVSGTDQQDPDPGNNSDTAAVTVQGSDLAITKVSQDGINPAEGDQITYRITVTNNGADAATGIVVSDLLPAGLTWVGDNPDQGTYNPVTGEWTLGALASGDSKRVDIDVAIDAGTAGSVIDNTATITASTPTDSTSADNVSSELITVQSSDLEVTKTASHPLPNEGNAVIYTITVENHGPTKATNVVVMDLLPPGVTFVSAAPSSGNYDEVTGEWSPNDLDPSAIETLAIQVTVDAGTGGTTIVNTATATAVTPPDPNPANDSQPAPITVQSADLQLTKSVSSPLPNVGQTITYTVAVSNAGPDSATSVTITDLLPAGLTYQNASVTHGTYVSGSGLWTAGSIAAADSATLSLVATVNSGTTGQTIWNVASVTGADQADPSPGNEADSASVTISLTVPIDSADLAVDKTVDVSNPGDGETFHYTITLTNNGPDPAAAVTVTDKLPTTLFFVSATPSRGIYSSGNGRWDIGAVAVAEVVTLDLAAQPKPETGGRTITNTASVSSSSVPDPVPGNSSDSIAITVGHAELGITKGVDNASPNEGATVTYTLTLRNDGPDGTTGVLVTDLLPAGLTFAGAVPTVGTYVSSTGVWSVGAMAAADTVSLALSALVDAGTAGGTITNTALVTASAEADTLIANDSASSDVTVRLANLSLTKTVDDAAPPEGATLAFTLTLANAGPDSATGVTVTDVLPAGLTFQSDLADQGAYDSGSGAWTAGIVAPGDTASLVITATVDAGTNGTSIWNTAQVTATDVADATPANHVDSVRVDIPLITGVSVSLSQTPASRRPGQTNVGFATVSLANSDPGPYTLQAIAFDNVTAGPGTGPQLDAEFGTMTLYRDDGDFVFEPASDTPLAQATVAAGRLVFAGLAVAVPAGSAFALHVGGSVALTARDGDVLDLEVGGATDVVFDTSPIFVGSWPAAAAGGNTVDGMVVAQVAVQSHPNVNITGGGAAALAFEVKVPANGYAADTLNEIRLVNGGNATASLDYSLSIWTDGGNGAYDGGAGDDALLGNATGVGAAWALTGLSATIPTTGRRVFAVAQATSGAASDATIRLAIPGTGTGLVVASGNDGPLDAATGSSRTLTIKPPPSPIDVIVRAQTTSALPPGGSPVPVLRFLLTNGGSSSETLDAVTVVNRTTGGVAATQANLDADWGPLSLSRDRSADGPALERAAVVGFSSGSLTFAGLGETIAAGDSAEFVVLGSASLAARDGDPLDLRIDNAGAFVFRRGVALSGTFPLDPAGAFPVDGLVAAQVTVGAVGPSLLAGAARSVSLNVLLPANGYESDSLIRLDIQNQGSAQNGTDITKVEAWADDGDDAFDALTDTPLGQLTFTGVRWERTGLSVPIPAGAGQRIFVTTDLADLATAGRTVRLAIPGPPDYGLGMLSNNDGPLDAAIVSSQQTISTIDRIALTASAVTPGVAAPGAPDRVLLNLAAENTYSVPRTLTALTVTNLTTGPGTAAQRDAELEQLTLWIDNGNGTFDGSPFDQPAATAFYSAGQAPFTGLSWTIPAGATRRLWLTGDVSLTAAADGDVLATHVVSQAHVSFSVPTSLAAGFPLDSGARWTIDGLVADQIANYGAPNLTLGPNEGPALALDVGLPANGYAGDVLSGLTVVNLGTATSGDLADVHLWRDGGDGSFDAAGADDTDLGALAFVAGRWILPGLTEPLSGSASRFFVSVSASASPADSSTIRLTIPVDGLEMQSSNDGPRDAAIANANTLLLSTAVLLANLEITPGASTVDSTVTVSMRVRNLHATAAIDSVMPSALSPSGVGTLDPLTGPLPAEASIAPLSEQTFTWTFRAASSGAVRLTGRATGVENGAGTPRQSLAVTSNTHQIFVQAQDLEVFATQSMPFSINRSQQNVVPLSITFTNPAGPGGSDIKLRGFRVRLESEAGDIIVPADLLSRVVVNEGAVVYLDKTTLESSAVEMDLTLAQPALIASTGPSASATLAIALDISDSTSVPNFRLRIVDASWFQAEDATSGGPVNISLTEPVAFPITSGLARIVAEATQVDVVEVPGAPFTAGQGQDDVLTLTMSLYNPDASGLAADARVTTFDVQLVDSVGAAIAAPQNWIERIRVDGAAQNHLDRALVTADDSTLTLNLSTLVSVPVNTVVPITVSVDIASASALGAFRVQLADSAFFDARDANTGAPLPVLYGSEPVTGPLVTVQAPADSATASGTPLFPAAVAVGASDVPAMRVVLTHPGPAEAGAVRCDAVTLQCRDGAGVGLVPAARLDLVRVRVGATEVGLATNMPTSGSSVTVPLTGVLLAPLAQITFDVQLDVRVTAPATLFSLVIAADGLVVVDDNLGASVAVAAAVGESFPLTSGFTQLQAPARDLLVGFQDTMPAVLAADGRTVEVARLTLRNPAPATAGDIRVGRFDLLAADGDLGALDFGRVASSVQAWVGDLLWADTGPLDVSADMAALPAVSDSIVIPPGATVEIRFELALAEGADVPGFRVGVRADCIGVVQPESQLLSVSVLPEEGQSFPVWTQPGNFSGVTLKDSYSNFPNPFAAGREDTRLAFYLQDGGRVSLKLFTLRGELVRTLIDNAPRAAGLHQDTAWDGRNGRGHVVVNGVYLAEIAVSFDNGSSERILRKIAVVR